MEKTKGLMSKQYLHHVDIDFFSITWQVHTYLFALFHYPLDTHGSHFYKLTNFDAVELFFPYGLLTLKTLCDLTSFAIVKLFLHTYIKRKQKKNKERKYKKRHRTNTKKKLKNEETQK